MMQFKDRVKLVSGSILANGAESTISRWLPGGRRVGHEYNCASITGGAGRSFSVNMNTGVWKDFNPDSDLGGSDLVSLYAAIEGISQGEALQRLIVDHGIATVEFKSGKPQPPPTAVAKQSDVKVITPPSAPTWAKLGDISPSAIYEYLSESGERLFYVIRYDTAGKKTFQQMCYTNKGWRGMAYPCPRPLYGLQRLRAGDGNKPILIVEGEKTADAADELCGHIYCPITWPGGSSAASKADWSPIYGRKVLIIPDADAPGIAAADLISTILIDKCSEVKIIDVMDMPQGWDIADFDGTWSEFMKWAKPRVRTMAATVKDFPDVPPPPPPSVKPRDDGDPGPQEERIEEPDYVPQMIDPASGWKSIPGLPRTRSGELVVNEHTLCMVMDSIPQIRGHIWWDTFHRKVLTDWCKDGVVEQWTDRHTSRLKSYMQGVLGIHKCNKTLMYEGVYDYANRDERNEPLDWVSSREWDGKPRVDRFFHDYYGAVRNEYTTTVSKNFWLAMMARLSDPGSKADNMVILESKQGRAKTLSLEMIAGKWFASLNVSMDNKNFLECLQGKILVEICELDSFNKTDSTALKAIISRRIDTFRASYARLAEDVLRTCVLVGTTNHYSYLKDFSGNRRYWPIRCSYIDVDSIGRDREQLFAEAYARYLKGETWYQIDLKLAEEEQEIRRERDAWEYDIETYLVGKSETSIRDIAVQCLKMDVARVDIYATNRIKKILELFAWEQKRRPHGSRSGFVWCPPVDVNGGQSTIQDFQDMLADA